MSQSEKTSWCAALKLVPARWRADFTQFIEDGEASEGFLDFLAQDADCRQACEMVLRADQDMAWLLAATFCPPGVQRASSKKHDQNVTR